MKAVVFLIVSFLVGLNSFGQILNQKVVVFDVDPFYNSDWIKLQGIKSITSEISFKKDQRPIRKTDHFLTYYFNKQGLIVSKRETRDVLNRRDTLETHYKYDAENRLEKVIHKDAYGYWAMNYKRNNLGEVISVFHSREEQELNGEFKRHSIVWKDSVAIVDKNDSTLREVYFNNFGKAYKDVLLKFDKNYCLTLKREMNRIGGEFAEERYERGKNCNLQKINYKGSYGNSWEKRTMKFNDFNLLSDETFYLKGELIRTRKYTYTENLELELFLERNLLKKEMKIIQFSYLYY